ncbi:MAG: beta-ketoacyl-ACP synthase III [Candidatus Merdivicinus sp.]
MMDSRKEEKMGIQILGTGSFVPERIVENEEFTQYVETSDEWIVKHSGIKRRHLHDGANFEMAVQAAQRALENAGLSAEDLDMILCTTVTSDYYTPSLACIVQGKIGASSAIAFDINAACAGFVFGLDVAHLYLQNGMRRIMVISSEKLSQITDYTDRSTCVLFGDGAGAVILGPSDRPFASVLGTDGTGACTLFARHKENSVPFVQTRSTQSCDGFIESKPEILYMDGHKVYKFAVTAMPKAVREVCEKYGIALDQIDWLIPHQANIRIIQTANSALKFPMEKTICNIAERANTSSACIPIALDEAIRDGRIQKGQTICLVGFGAGLVYGSAIFEY